MSNTTTKRYRNEILEGQSLSNYESTLHKVEKDNFRQIIERVLKEYGLNDQLKQAKIGQEKLCFIELGCSEGLILHDLADVLEQHGLLVAADLYGVDVDSTAIATAEEFARLGNPPRPYLNFYVHQLGHALTDCKELVADGRLEFDFIIMRRKLEYLPRAKQRFEQLYQALKPGGVIYFRTLLSTSDERDGSIVLHPAIQPLYLFIREYLNTLNGGISIARSLRPWLVEAGAEQVEVSQDIVPVGGPTERGRNYLRNNLISMESLLPKLVELGYLTLEQYYKNREQLFSEVSTATQGQVTFVDVLAKKPL